MAVRCVQCGRLSRNEAACEWCRAEIPAEARQLAAARSGGRAAQRASPSHETIAPATRSDGSEQADAPQAVIAPQHWSDLLDGDAPTPVDAEAPTEENAAHGVVNEEPDFYEPLMVDADASGETGVADTDRATRAIGLLILLQLGLTLYLGGFSWWSLTGFLWLGVVWGVRERATWSMALPLVLFSLDVALLLFGVGPRERAGFPALTTLDFLLIVMRLGIWALIWRLREEMA